MSKRILCCLLMISFSAQAFETKDGPQAVRIQFKKTGKVNEQIKKNIMKIIECKRDAGEAAVYSKKFASDGTGHICVQFKNDQTFLQGMLLIQKTIKDYAFIKGVKDWSLGTGVSTLGHPICDDKSLTDFITSDQTLERMGDNGLSKDKCYQK